MNKSLYISCMLSLVLCGYHATAQENSVPDTAETAVLNDVVAREVAVTSSEPNQSHQEQEPLVIPTLPVPPQEAPLTSPPTSNGNPELSFLDRFKDEELQEIVPILDQTVTATVPPLATVTTITPAEVEQVTTPTVDNGSRFLMPWEFGDPNDLIEINFENAELSNLISYFEKKYALTFILDDQINPIPGSGKSVLGTKISFKTHKPLSKKQAWNIFVTFLDMAGLGPQPGPGPSIFRIASVDSKSQLSVFRGPLPLFIGVSRDLLPDNDTRIRYVYFVENTSIDIIKNVIDSMKSATAPNLIVFPEMRAIVITDRSVNVRSMLDIIHELDRVNMPETLSVIKLRRTDATKVADLYKSLIKDETQNSLQARLLGGRRTPTVSYFSEGTKVFAEPNTNSLILLGTRDAIKKIEDFLINSIDKELDVPFSPLHVYTLRYVEADVVAGIIKEAVQFQPESEASRYGGVRNGDKFFKPISVTAEKSGNRIIINADYEDYLKIYDMLQKIDIEQPQVAIKMIIMDVQVTNQREFGTQIRDKSPSYNGLLGNQVNAQTSGLFGSPVIENPDPTPGAGAVRLLGNLVNIATRITGPGATVLSFGSDQYGVFGMLGVLESLTNVSVIANPFLVTTHKYPASVKLGEIRRVLTGITNSSTGPQDSFADLEAKLEVSVTPQVSYEGLITLDVSVVLEQFTSAGVNSGDRTHREVKTSVIVSDNSVIALGGMMRDRVETSESRVPILADIPLVGWFFKNRTKTVITESLLILMSPEIIPPHTEEFADRFTKTKYNEATEMINAINGQVYSRDPVHRWFFKDDIKPEQGVLNDYFDVKNQFIDPSQKEQIAQNLRRQREESSKQLSKYAHNYYRLSDQLQAEG